MLSGWYEYDYADHNFLLFRPHIIVYIILVNFELWNEEYRDGIKNLCIIKPLK